MKNRPPKSATRFFEWLCGSAYVEDLTGDLDEWYQYQRSSRNKFQADCFYWKQVLSLIFSYALRKRRSAAAISPYYPTDNWTMMRNYLQISIRNLRKQPTFTILNIVGLAMGMSIMMLSLAMYVDLLKFDEHHKDADRIFRLITHVEQGGDTKTFASFPPALAKLITDQHPQVELDIPINDKFHTTLVTGAGEIEIEGYVTNTNFLKTFSFPMAEGSIQAINEPNSIIITHELAIKLFGTANALGKTIEDERWGSVNIGGVLKPYPKYSHFAFDALMSTATFDPLAAHNLEAQWTQFYGNYFYLKLPPGVEENSFMENVQNLAKNGDEYFHAEGKNASFELQAIGDINPNVDIEDDLGIVFEHIGFLLFFGIALLILLPACFNYANMSIAKSLKRSKEIGIRKVIGSSRKQIVRQFLVETVLVTLSATLLSAYIFLIIRQEFISMLVGRSSLSLAISWEMFLAFLIFGLIVGVLTGIIPAVYFSKISSLTALKSNISDARVSISGLRKGLLTAQFALTLIFMIGIGTLISEYRYSLSYNMGFTKENILVVPMVNDKQDVLKATFLKNPDVRSVSFTSSIPGTHLSNREYVYFQNLQDSMRYYSVQIDDSFIDQMNLEMVWGSPPRSTKKSIQDVVVNEEFMKDLKVIDPKSDSLMIQLKEGPARISGVIKNYNHQPLNARIYPLMLSYSEKGSFALVSIASNDLINTMESMDASWREVFPNDPFQATFLTHEIEKAYDFFRISLKIFGFLAFLAVTISCLGLLGMVIYSTENRTKEVAIRKIMGAGKLSLLKTLGGLFFRLWLIAIMIGVPIAYLFYNYAYIGMLNKFSEGVGFWEIAISVLVTVALGSSAIIWQTNKIIKINPAVNLRNE